MYSRPWMEAWIRSCFFVWEALMVNRTMARPSLVRAVVLEKARGRYRRQILRYMTADTGKYRNFRILINSLEFSPILCFERKPRHRGGLPATRRRMTEYDNKHFGDEGSGENLPGIRGAGPGSGFAADSGGKYLRPSGAQRGGKIHAAENYHRHDAPG